MGVRSGTTKKTFAVNKNRLLQTTVYRELLTKPQPESIVFKYEIMHFLLSIEYYPLQASAALFSLAVVAS